MVDRFFGSIFKRLENYRFIYICFGSVLATIIIFNETLQFATLIKNYVSNNNFIIPLLSLGVFYSFVRMAVEDKIWREK